MTLRSLLAAACSAFALAACGQPAAQQAEPAPPSAAAETAQSESERLSAWFEEQFQIELAYSPEGQTYLGLIDDLDAYGRWDDPTREAFDASMARARGRLAHMHEAFDYEALDEQAQVSWRFFEFIIENQIRQEPFWGHSYIFHQFFGPHTEMATLLIGYHRVETADHARAFVRRLEGMGPVLRDQIALAEERAQAGVLPPRFAYPVIIRTAEGMITGAPFDDSGEDSPLWASLQEKVAALELPEAEAGEILETGRAALLNSVGPAYQALAETMERHLEMATDDDGVWKLPDGEEYYRVMLANFTTRDDLTAEQIHQTGLDEVAHIHGEMREIMARVGFEGSLQDFFAHLRDSEEFYYPNTDEGRARYLAEATAMIDRVTGRLPEYFGRLPQAPMEVRAVEPYRIETATGAFYEPAPLDRSQPAAYYINLADMGETPVYQMETLAYHEGNPGHHMQIAISQELENTPMFQRLTWYSAYGEGWALYAEALGKDMGFFEDPYQDFGRLSYEVFRAARLVVDTGIHHHRWTRQQAMDYMLENTPMTRGDLDSEVMRYIVWPGQAVSYKIGMLTILELRERARAELGEAFDIRGFHDVVLGSGSVPLSLLEELVEAWIEERRG
ncbi:MAG: DUF885 domain-containing protein [Maricaulaceae bacterium]|nr:DUF885 domain-containing protein [Maricaulaceae bacterium]